MKLTRHQSLYAFNIVYTLTIPLVKISVLLLYYRVFHTRHFKWVVYFGITFMILFALSTVLVDIFNCNPIRASWDKTIPAKCVDPVILYRSTAIINLVTDILILCTPAPMVWRLNMSIRNRLALYSIFLLGGLLVSPNCVCPQLIVVAYVLQLVFVFLHFLRSITMTSPIPMSMWVYGHILRSRWQLHALACPPSDHSSGLLFITLSTHSALAPPQRIHLRRGPTNPATHLAPNQISMKCKTPGMTLLQSFVLHRSSERTASLTWPRRLRATGTGR